MHRLRSRPVRDADPDPRIALVEALQMRQEIKLQGHIARTDPDLAGLHVRHLQHLALTHPDPDHPGARE